MNLEHVIISAPWGNYIKAAGCTRTWGTFTAARRGGIPNRAWRVLKTVRYYRRLDAWVNKIGLRNPGIDWLVAKAKQSGTAAEVGRSIVSIHGFTPEDWSTLLAKIREVPVAAIELNMSCPNIGEIHVPTDLFAGAREVEQAIQSTGEDAAKAIPRVIVKLPPIRYEALAHGALAAGLRAFHCCNTLPVRGGGMSGRPLQPLSLACIQWMRKQEAQAGERLRLIGGGGVREPDDVDRYADAGADHVAVGTKLMRLSYLWSDSRLRPIVQRATERLAST